MRRFAAERLSDALHGRQIPTAGQCGGGRKQVAGWDWCKLSSVRGLRTPWGPSATVSAGVSECWGKSASFHSDAPDNRASLSESVKRWSSSASGELVVVLLWLSLLLLLE